MSPLSVCRQPLRQTCRQPLCQRSCYSQLSNWSLTAVVLAAASSVSSPQCSVVAAAATYSLYSLFHWARLSLESEHIVEYGCKRNLLDKRHLVQLPYLQVLENARWLMARRKQPRNLMLRKMTHRAFTAASCIASLTKSYDIGFVVKADVRNRLMHYVQELQLKTNISSVKYVYQTTVMPCVAIVWLFSTKQYYISNILQEYYCMQYHCHLLAW